MPSYRMPTMLRTPFALATLIAGTASAADPYLDQRELSVAATGLTTLEIDVGAGSLDLRGEDSATEIRLAATVWLEDHPADARRVAAALAKHVDIELERQGERARVFTDTRDPGIGYSLPHVDLTLVVPRRLTSSGIA